jgi:iron complex transport system substrate-binding protein
MEGRKSGYLDEPHAADTLRVKECGSQAPFFFVGLFLLGAKMNVGTKKRWTALACGAALATLLLCGAGRAATRTVTDEVGRQVTLPDNVQRIVSLAPNLTEIVYALGAGQKLVGVTDYCDYPPDAKTKTKIGSPIEPSLEAIVALKPDLVLAAAMTMNRRETVDALDGLGMAVYSTNTESVEGTLISIQDIASAIGTPERGRAVTGELRARLDALRAQMNGVTPKRALFVIWTDPLITIGPRTFLADALRRAGAESVVQSGTDWPQISLEEVVRLQPDVLIFTENHGGSGKDELDELRQRPAWRGLAAVREGHVIVAGEELDRPSPRLVDAVEELARQLHPEVFAPTPPSNGVELPMRRMDIGAVEDLCEEAAPCSR